MVIEQLISPTVPILILSDTGDKAIQMMDECHLNQLPLVEDDKYIGLVSENDVLDMDNQETSFKEANLFYQRSAVLANGHPFDAIKLTNEHALSIIPVIDNENNYMGSVTRGDLLRYVAERSGLDNPGGILVLEIMPNNYSLYEIARICESEEVLLINTQIFSNKITGKLEVTLKTNRTNLSGLISAFERYNYKVIEVFGDSTDNGDITSRYNLLMNYINM